MALWFKKKKDGDTASKKASVPDGKGAASEDSVQPRPQTREKSDSSQSAAEPSAAPDVSAHPAKADGKQPTGQKSGFFSRLKRGLAKTRNILTSDIEDVFSGKKHIDEEMLDEIEERLITSDIGVQTTMALMKAISKKANKISSPEELKETIKHTILQIMEEAIPEAAVQPITKPHVIMVVGVNGVGKTTTIGKLASRKIGQGQKVLIAAADTFRAAAVEQLAIWAERAGADFVRHKDNADPAAVAYDGMEAALARGIDTVFIDTAGRLHTKVNLMEELKKIQRTVAKKIPDAPHEIILVLDATTGQNGLSQAKLFHESMGITGLALTKLDGTAKGGIVISICQQLKIPLLYVGVGEGIEDLQPFDVHQFVDALF